MIPVAKPMIGEEEIEAVAEVMRSGMIAGGAVVTEFEDQFASFCECSYAVGLNSGTAALHAALLADDIGAGDEVIVPAFTFIATATSVSMCGGRPVMVDVDPDTFTIDPESVSEHINSRTKAVIGVHLFGQPFDLKPVQEICDDHNLTLIEDCAQAHGAMYDGRKVGQSGLFGCFSFYPTKNMTTGEGGMITGNDPDRIARVRRIINHGQSDKYLHTELGFNLRMSNIDAAIGKVQLSRLGWMNERRILNAEYLSANLSADGLKTPVCREGSTHVYHQYVVKLTEDFPMSREEFMRYLQDNGIGSAVHYPMPVHRQPLYSDNEFSCPVAEKLSESVLSLPVHPGVTIDDCRYICETINRI
ncbi:MAG: DegT/DnrJ/EryC1/StrS family aminotransferase [Euryarchaeota archaeon]|nr:DegT/DnrJ/EryC1/StrS family aminotransferase [Euryarchaeota archaeon]